MKNENIFNTFPTPEQFMDKSFSNLTKQEKAFYDAYETACCINKTKPYIFQPLKGIPKQEKQKQFFIQKQCCVPVYGCLFDVVSGKIYKKQRDMKLFCKPSVFGIERFYYGEISNDNNIFGKHWYLEYQIHCIYDTQTITICHINGQKEEFYKEGKYFYPKNKNSLHKIDTVDEKKQEIIWRKGNLLYTFNFDGRLKKIGDNYGNGILFWYINGFRWIEKITSTFGQQLFFQYKDNKVAEITDNIGRKIKYEYEGEYLTSVLYPNGGKKKYQYESQTGRLCSIENAYGEILFQTEYNRYYKPQRFYDRKDGWLEVTYHQRERKTILSGEKKEIIYSYNKQGFVEEIEDSAIGKVMYGYDNVGNIVSRKNIHEKESRYTYDAFGRIVQKALANGNIICYQYNASNQLSKWSVSTGYQEILYYTKQGNVSEIKKYLDKNLSATVFYQYDMLGRLRQKTFPNQNSVCYEYKNEQSIFPEKIIYSNGFQVKYEYDEVNRLVRKIQGKEIEEYKYNYMDLKIQTIYADGSYDFRLYDLSGKQKEIILPQENMEGKDTLKPIYKYRYFYDKKGILSYIVSPEKKIHKKREIVTSKKLYPSIKKYNACGKIIAKWTPAIQQEDIKYIYCTYQYDKCLNLIEKKIGLEYVQAEEIPEKYYKKEYFYDKRGNFVGNEKEKIFRYIQKDRLHKIIELIAENKERMYCYEYNNRGLVSKIVIYETGIVQSQEICFQYDYNGNLIQIQLPNQKSFKIEYDRDGNLIPNKEQWFIQQKFQNSFSVFSQHKKQQRKAKEGIVFEKDLKGRIIKINDIHTNQTLASYRYDCLNQITQIEQKGQKTNFFYDKKQNLIKITYPNQTHKILEGNNAIEKEQ